MEKRKKKGRIESLVGKIFIVLLFLIMIVNLLVPDREKSEEENRMLTGFPKMTVENLISGDYMEQFEDYMCDQFAGRHYWRSVKVGLSRLGGSKMENGVYIGRSGQLMDEIKVPEQDQLAQNIQVVKSYAETYPDISTSMLLVPDSACVLKASLPLLASVPDQNKLISNVKKGLGDSVNWIDAVSVMNKHQNEKIYYKTDSHWTSLGAFYAFRQAAPALGIEGDVSDKYVSYAVSTTFNGVLASKSGVNMDEEEQIDIYVPKDCDNDLIVDYVDEGVRKTSIFDSSRLETRDQYSVFMGGNKSLIDIKTVSPENRRLLIVKDSFANNFIQFLTPYFREIVMVDPRYYSGTIQDIMSTYRITDTLFLYSGNTFFTDNSMSGVFAFE